MRRGRKGKRGLGEDRGQSGETKAEILRYGKNGRKIDLLIHRRIKGTTKVEGEVKRDVKRLDSQ